MLQKTIRAVAVLLMALTVALFAAMLTACEEEPAPPAQEQEMPEEEMPPAEEEQEPPEQSSVPVKVQDGEALELEEGSSRTLFVADYIAANGNAVTASSADTTTAEAALSDGLLTVTAAAEGETAISLACADVTVTFSVTVYKMYTVSVDGVSTRVRGGEMFTLPQAAAPADENFMFLAWRVGEEWLQPGEKVTVNADLVITSVTQRKAPVKVKDGGALTATVGTSCTLFVSDYITTYGNDVSVHSSDGDKVTASAADGTLTLTPKWAGSATVTLSCGSVRVEFAVTVKAAEVSAPVFENGTISFDLYESQSGSYDFSPVSPDGIAFAYQYEVTPERRGVNITGNTLTYTGEEEVQDLVLTVSVTATAQVTGETVVKTAHFTVTVNVSDSRPAALEQALVLSDTVDLYEHGGAYAVDLAANISNAHHVASYTVNGAEVVGTTYAVTGTFTDEAREIVLAVAAQWGEGESVTYSYRMHVIDSTAYRMPNGGFEEDDHAVGWTGMTGSFSNADGSGDTNNDGWYYAGADAGTETVCSPAFVVGNSGWITFKLGSMMPCDEDGLRDIWLEVVAQDGDAVLARVRNVCYSAAAAHRLYDYKLDLSAFKGERVYLRAVDGEQGGVGCGIRLDAVVTWYDAEPSDSFTDLSGAYFLDCALLVDLKDSDTAQIVPCMLSQGLLATQYTYAVQGAQGGISVSDMALTATACGEYSLTVTVYAGNRAVSSFAVSVTVTNSTPIPVFEDITKTYAYPTWMGDGAPATVCIALPDLAGSRFSCAYTVTAGDGAILSGGTLSFTPSAAGTVTFMVKATLTDTLFPAITDLPSPEFTVTLVFKDNEIALAGDADIRLAVDVYEAEDKEQFVIDFADYLTIPAGRQVSYAVTLDSEAVATDGSQYTVIFAQYSPGAVEKELVFAVTAVGGATIGYTVTVLLTDTTDCRIVNGGFDNNLKEWTRSGDIFGLGGISEDTTYWYEGISFNNDGKFFSALAQDASEAGTGTLTSPSFTVGGSGWITYKLGGAKNIEQVYMEVVCEDTGRAVILPNFDWTDYEGSDVRGCTLIAYKANLLEYGFARGDRVFIRITDNAVSDFGMFFLDSVVTYYPVGGEPDDSFCLVSRYRLYNGGFETGNLTGWTLSGGIGAVTSGSGSDEQGGEGAFLFSWQGADGTADATGTLTSSTFTLKAGAVVSFLFVGSAEGEISLEFVNAQTGAAIARFGASPDGEPVGYYYQFAQLTADTECYVRVTDNAPDGGFVLDNIQVNCTEVPQDYTLAIAATQQ